MGGGYPRRTPHVTKFSLISQGFSKKFIYKYLGLAPPVGIVAPLTADPGSAPVRYSVTVVVSRRK